MPEPLTLDQLITQLAGFAENIEERVRTVVREEIAAGVHVPARPAIDPFDIAPILATTTDDPAMTTADPPEEAAGA